MTTSVEQENFYRHSTVIVDHVKNSFTNLLQHYLDNQGEAGITFGQFVLNKRHVIYHLFDTRNACCLCPPGTRHYMRGVKALLYRSQMDTLFDNSSPATASSACTNYCCAPLKKGLRLKHLDVTLAIVLLLECTNIVSRASPEGRALDSLREKRNKFLGHVKEGRMSTEEYESSMDDIQKDLMVLAKIYGGETEVQQLMDEVRNKPFSSELYEDMIHKLGTLQSQMNEISEQVKQNLEESRKVQEENAKLIASAAIKSRQEIIVPPEPETVKLDQFLGNVLQDLIGTRDQGEFDRGNGNIVTWSFKGIIQGFKWKYRGICEDRATGLSCTATRNSRTGSFEHALRALFQQLNITDVKIPENFR